ncbi:hypothetical protein B0H14DRAFT_2335426 [Mycena olivaceomarginata]|nr:hypothetical protein B0H14DRAFT_2335426 [Mycena olivaceomarginata]
MEVSFVTSATAPDPTRTLWQLFYSCVATIFACVWISVHPNVPGRDDSPWTRRWRRIQLMLIALITPEVITTFAIRQWLTARQVVNGEEGKSITMIHGFFLAMGGFVCEEGNRLRPLTFYDLNKTIPSGKLSADIQDKSKGDGLSKLLAVVQLLWFSIQLLGRLVLHFSITELEVMTIALVALNITLLLIIKIYFFWWSKPLLAEDQIILYTTKPRSVNDTPNNSPNQADLADRFADAIWHMFWLMLYGGMRNDTVDNLFSRRSRVHILWSGQISEGYDMSSLVKSSIAFALAAIFGAIHCAAWSLYFDTAAEKWLWRCSAIFITALPAGMLLLNIVVNIMSDIDSVAHFLDSCGRAILYISPIPYCIARIILLALPFVQLRSLPENALRVVSWDSYIPHI